MDILVILSKQTFVAIVLHKQELLKVVQGQAIARTVLGILRSYLSLGQVDLQVRGNFVFRLLGTIIET